MTTTTTTLAVGGTTPKIDETVTLSPAAAMVMALPNVSLASPPGPLSADIIRERRDAARKMSS
jgi:hypothetical protein